jgi:hypothetical protein
LEQPRRRLLALVALALTAAAVFGWMLLGGKAPAPHSQPAALAGDERIIVEVLNGSGRRGLARVAARELRRAGFDVVYFGTSSDSIRVTQVLARRGDSTAAAQVAGALGTSRVRVSIDTLLRVDVTVLLGDDYHPPPGLRP